MKKILTFCAVVALAFAFTSLSLTGCGGSGGEGIDDSVTYTGTGTNGNYYELIISKAPAKAVYDPEPGDIYDLKVTFADKTTGTSNGTVISVVEGKITLVEKSEGGEGENKADFTVTIINGALSSVNGYITVDGEQVSISADFTSSSADGAKELPTLDENKKVEKTDAAFLAYIAAADFSDWKGFKTTDAKENGTAGSRSGVIYYKGNGDYGIGVDWNNAHNGFSYTYYQERGDAYQSMAGKLNSLSNIDQKVYVKGLDAYYRSYTTYSTGVAPTEYKRKSGSGLGQIFGAINDEIFFISDEMSKNSPATSMELWAALPVVVNGSRELFYFDAAANTIWIQQGASYTEVAIYKFSASKKLTSIEVIRKNQNDKYSMTLTPFNAAIETVYDASIFGTPELLATWDD